MALEKERPDTSIVMDEDQSNRSMEPVLWEKGGVYAAAPDRDPNEMNAHLKVGSEDVIAEPVFTHSFDRVWIGSHAAFALVKHAFYRLLTTVLAVPMAFITGGMFGVLSCIHIWLVMPLMKSLLMLLPSAGLVWRRLTDSLIGPFYLGVGRSLSSVRVTTMDK